jgi:hypothetical protein
LIWISSFDDDFFIVVKEVCVILKCIAGPHIGQRFRLEPTVRQLPIAMHTN